MAEKQKPRKSHPGHHTEPNWRSKQNGNTSTHRYKREVVLEKFVPSESFPIPVPEDIALVYLAESELPANKPDKFVHGLGDSVSSRKPMAQQSIKKGPAHETIRKMEEEVKNPPETKVVIEKKEFSEIWDAHDDEQDIRNLKNNSRSEGNLKKKDSEVTSDQRIEKKSAESLEKNTADSNHALIRPVEKGNDEKEKKTEAGIKDLPAQAAKTEKKNQDIEKSDKKGLIGKKHEAEKIEIDTNSKSTEEKKIIDTKHAHFSKQEDKSHSQISEPHVNKVDSHVNKTDSHVNKTDSHVNKTDSHTNKIDSHIKKVEPQVKKPDSHVHKSDPHSQKVEPQPSKPEDHKKADPPKSSSTKKLEPHPDLSKALPSEHNPNPENKKKAELLKKSNQADSQAVPKAKEKENQVNSLTSKQEFPEKVSENNSFGLNQEKYPSFPKSVLQAFIDQGCPFARILLLTGLEDQNNETVSFPAGLKVYQRLWFYKDLNGSVHGPFSCLEMFDWVLRGHLPEDLSIAFCNNDFSPMKKYESIARKPQKEEKKQTPAKEEIKVLKGPWGDSSKLFSNKK